MKLSDGVRRELEAAERSGVLKARRYVVKGKDGNLDEVLCKCCGTSLQRVRPYGDEPFEVYMQGNTRVEKWRVRLRPLNNFRQIAIKFEDGSEHSTPVCSGCLKRLDADKLRAMYLADLEVFESEGPKDALDLDKLARKEVVGFEVEEL